MNTRGFSLIEILACLTVMAVLAVLALPNLLAPLAGARLSALASEFAAATDLARSEAVRRHINVVICPRSSTGSCQSSATNWSQGWLLYADADADDLLDSTEIRLQERAGMPSDTTVGSGSAAPLVFIASGELAGVDGASRTITMTAHGLRRDVVLQRNGKSTIVDY